MSLKDKASRVDLGNLGDEPADEKSGQVVAPAATRRSGVAAITQSITAHHKVQDLEAELATFKDGNTVVKLDPKRIRQSRWKNRHELSFQTPRYLELKAEIETAGENVQPIKVRVVGQGADGKDEYEIVYGRRRHRACLELGLLVNAIVVTRMSEEELFSEMERENRNREDLTPWEQGVMYKDALEAGLYSSQRQLAAKLGVNQALVSSAVKLASLPEAIIAAFPSPLDLQFRWAQELADVLEKDAVKVTAEAEAIGKMAERPASKVVLDRLISVASPPQGEGAGAQQRELKVGDRVVGTLLRDKRGGIALKVKGGALQPAAEKRLIEFIEKLFKD
ncbi:ParB/RepB/Spo0J family partition protein [Methylibium petroleiphilum]|uniref:ParB-like N-terminal domain-containing protein n=1 Tax=Methylibium petroleiphilum (strain ATCC BAA-1232 / LMG 22953 / PM1) TaxID=420662 RepID=A2SMR7_METPP|nr:ParB/RepB/Spo0J family partition protein [Methylibium petroleiphilum]ABM96856.1 hypothetical protein Mpe_B0077 [Methylibium petroleiphilum PM1]